MSVTDPEKSSGRKQIPQVFRQSLFWIGGSCQQAGAALCVKYIDRIAMHDVAVSTGGKMRPERVAVSFCKPSDFIRTAGQSRRMLDIELRQITPQFSRGV